MKINFFIILAFVIMNQSFSQIPPTPPTPPTVTANSSNGITHSEAETNTSYAFSCAFDSKHFSKIESLITEGYKSFSGNLHSKDKRFEVKIELKESELKMEYKSFCEETFPDKTKLKSIASKIIGL